MLVIVPKVAVPELRIAVVIRIGRIGMVEEVECLCTELKGQALVNWEVLEHREVHQLASRTFLVIAMKISVSELRRSCISRGINTVRCLCHYGQQTRGAGV